TAPRRRAPNYPHSPAPAHTPAGDPAHAAGPAHHARTLSPGCVAPPATPCSGPARSPHRSGQTASPAHTTPRSAHAPATSTGNQAWTTSSKIHIPLQQPLDPKLLDAANGLHLRGSWDPPRRDRVPVFDLD